MCSTVSHQIEIHAPSRNGRLIVFRYLSREVLSTTIIVTGFLMLVIMSTHMIGYLNDAAAGKISVEAVFSIALNRAPFFLQVVFPLGFLLGIFLSHGRMHLDNEIVSLQSAGFSEWKLISYTLIPAALVSILVAITSTYLTPLGVYEVKRIFAQYEDKSSLSMLQTGVFQKHDRKQVSYIREINEDGHFSNIFLSSASVDSVEITLAERAETIHDSDGTYLVLSEGRKYIFPKNSKIVEELAFKQYGSLIEEKEFVFNSSNLDAVPTLELFNNLEKNDYLGRLSWRLSLPFIPFVIAIIGVQLARTSPRKGRFARLIPGILIYQAYILVLMEARSNIEDGSLSVWAMLLINLLALVLGFSMVLQQSFWHRFFEILPTIPNFKKKY